MARKTKALGPKALGPHKRFRDSNQNVRVYLPRALRERARRAFPGHGALAKQMRLALKAMLDALDAETNPSRADGGDE